MDQTPIKVAGALPVQFGGPSAAPAPLSVIANPLAENPFLLAEQDVKFVAIPLDDAKNVSKDPQKNGYYGFSGIHFGVVGEGGSTVGVFGIGPQIGVSGQSTNKNSGAGVVGNGKIGVAGSSLDSHGVHGSSTSGAGVSGESKIANGVSGTAHGGLGSGVLGTCTGSGAGVTGESVEGIGVVGRGDFLAARFEGDVEITGDLRFANADCAEDFDIGGGCRVEPGTVMVLGDKGELYRSERAYDRRVAGVISGAGNYKPGIVLDKKGSGDTRQPVALLGKVYCKADAQYGSIEIGDLLTTSGTKGHAMRADELSRPFGAIIGKALQPLQSGQGLILILVALQ